jgi:hypothetical protein
MLPILGLIVHGSGDVTTAGADEVSVYACGLFASCLRLVPEGDASKGASEKLIEDTDVLAVWIVEAECETGVYPVDETDELGVCNGLVVHAGPCTSPCAATLAGLVLLKARLRVRGDFGGTCGGNSSSVGLGSRLGEDLSTGAEAVYVAAGRSIVMASGSLGLLGIKSGAKSPGSSSEDRL